MIELTPEKRRAILRSARAKVAAGHTLSNCEVDGPEDAPNPRKSFCLRGAIEKAAEEHGLEHEDATQLSYDCETRLGLALDGLPPCNFSDIKGKAGCLKVLDDALADAA